jgi:glycosyltransferase involved in cell wall biosynthesis
MTNRMETPGFGIVITSHNQAAFICDAVGSALAQRHPPREVIVVDDASTDGSPALLEKYGGRILLVKMSANRGACVARNLGASKATGTHLVFLDGDDVMLPWALDVYSRLLALKNPSLILSSLLHFSGRIPAHPPAAPQTVEFCEYETLLKKDRPCQASASAFVIHREAFFAAGGWSEPIFPMEDLDLLVKLGCAGLTVQILSPPTKCYRVHPGNTVNQIRSCINMLQAVIRKEKRGEYPGGRSARTQRSAFIGGPAWFWVKKGFRFSAYREVAALASKSWPMILAGTFFRARAVFHGRQPIESIDLPPQLPAPGALRSSAAKD